MMDASDQVPVRLGQWSESDGRIQVRRQKFGPVGSWFLRMIRIDPMMTVTLDPLGSAAWKAMDGRTAKEVLVELQQTFPDETDLGPRLGQFLSTMVSNKLVELRSTSR